MLLFIIGLYSPTMKNIAVAIHWQIRYLWGTLTNKKGLKSFNEEIKIVFLLTYIIVASILWKQI